MTSRTMSFEEAQRYGESAASAFAAIRLARRAAARTPGAGYYHPVRNQNNQALYDAVQAAFCAAGCEDAFEQMIQSEIARRSQVQSDEQQRIASLYEAWGNGTGEHPLVVLRKEASEEHARLLETC